MPEKMVIDGSMGEGGGQVVRTALAMSVVSQRPVEIQNIRAKRSRPGLRPQHVAVASALCDICSGELKGLKVGSSKLSFFPDDAIPGSYEIDVGTAGSISLVLQGLIPVMLHSGGRWTLTLKGGTDTLWSPPWDYFNYVYKEHLARMGVDLSVKLHKRGFYPSGGGEVSVSLRPSSPKPLIMEERGELLTIAGRGFLSKLPLDVWERMRVSVLNGLIDFGSITGEKLTVEHVMGSRDKAAGITLWAEFQETRLGSDCVGEKGVKAEIVGERAVEPLLKDIVSGATVDVRAADQILPIMALVPDKSIILVRETSEHFTTCLDLLKKFMDVETAMTREDGVVRFEMEGKQ